MAFTYLIFLAIFMVKKKLIKKLSMRFELWFFFSLKKIRMGS